MDIGKPLRKIVVEPIRDPVPRREREQPPAPSTAPDRVPAPEPVTR